MTITNNMLTEKHDEGEEDDGYKIEFKPVLEVPPLRTQTNDKVEHEKQLNAVVNFIENQ